MALVVMFGLLSFTTLNCQQARKRIGTDHEFTLFPENPPWLNPKRTFSFEITQHKKPETNPLLIQQHFAEIRSVTSEYSAKCIGLFIINIFI
jgi:hypothetical protein